MTLFSPSRSAALDRLSYFKDLAGENYTKFRNYDFGPERRDNVSMLSPYVRRRLVHESEIIGTIYYSQGFEPAKKFFQEVLWRTYWKGWLEMRPSAWESYKTKLLEARYKLSVDSELHARYDQAMSARTGIDCFDAWIAELNETGFLHNHARMWFASIWIFTLKLPWELGADFFFQQLLDADPASNTLSWRWVGGLHTKGKTYLASAANIREFSSGRFLVNDKLASEGAALPDRENYEVIKLLSLPKREYRNVALLLHSDHCQPEIFEHRIRPSVVLTISDFPLSDFDYKKSERSNGFDRAATADAASRASKIFNCPHLCLSLEELSELKRQTYAIEEVITPFAPVGDVQEGVFELGSLLDSLKLNLNFISDPWDDLLYPLAKKGYFDFNELIMCSESQLIDFMGVITKLNSKPIK